jgi:CrcB protein
MKILFIGMGGFFGSVARYLLSGAVQSLTRSIAFPYGTFAVNLIGCFLIGLFSQLSETKGFLTDLTRAFLVVGVLGGFTTFSAFGNESFNLLRSGETNLALINILGQVTLCLTGVWLGRVLAYSLWR